MSFASYEIGKLEQQVRELEEKNTILKAERDEFERQRNEVLGDLAGALDEWQAAHNAWLASPENGRVIDTTTDQIIELRKKHQL